METKIVYFDESGDDGNKGISSPYFVLTSISMNATDWQDNYNQYKNITRLLNSRYGWHVRQEMHMKKFLNDHNPYRIHGWSFEQKRNIVRDYFNGITGLKIETVNVIIDKTKLTLEDLSKYPVLEHALTYNIQRIENSYKTTHNFLAISDEGRVEMMRRTARKICAYNQIPSMYDGMPSRNMPVKGMIEDILEKDSSDSFFIQIADSMSYIVNLYYKSQIKHEKIPKRVSNVLSEKSIIYLMDRFKDSGILNTKASHIDEYGLVIYPK